MRNFVYILTILSSFILVGDCHSNEYEENECCSDTDQISTLVIYRPKGSPPLLYKPMITINNRKALLLPHGHHVIFKLIPGKYEILADWKFGHGVADQSIAIELLPQSTTYIKLTTSLSFPLSGHISGNIQQVGDKYFSNSTLYDKWVSTWFVGNEFVSRELRVEIRNEDLIAKIRSSDYFLKREAAKTIVQYGLYEKPVLDELEREVLVRYLDDNNLKIELDAVAWLCRALAQSGDVSYKDTIVKIKDGAKNKKLRKYATKYIKYFSKE